MELLRRVSNLEKVRKNAFEEIDTLYRVIDSPVGPLTLIANENALLSLTWGKSSGDFVQDRDHPILSETERQLKEYFSGKRTAFDIPLAPEGTDFQKRVWEELSKIPYGQTITYGEQAKRLGRPKAARAVGAANGRNPIGIIIPCHRVIGASGDLTGFAGGIEVKRELLRLEAV